jgi:hypothetical protein
MPLHIAGLPGDRSPKQDFIQIEANATMEALAQAGLEAPSNISAAALAAGVIGAFMPDEVGPASAIPDISASSRQRFQQVIRPNLARGTEQGNEQALHIAHQAGRLVGAAIMAQRVIDVHPPLSLNGKTVSVDGVNIEHQVQTGLVVEYGMGLNGLAAHLRNVKQGKYAVFGIQRDAGTATVLQGVTDFWKIPSDALRIVDGGIARRAQQLIDGRNKNGTDLLIASRVHGAGNDLKQGVAAAKDLLRLGGTFIARGPRRYAQGYDYDRVLQDMEREPSMHVDHSRVLRRTIPRGIEHNRLIVARKIK